MPSAVDTELARICFEKRKLSRQLAALRAGETRRRTALLRVAAIALCHDGESLEFIVQHLCRTAPHPFPLTDAVLLNADTEIVADWLDWRDGVCTPGQLALARRLVDEATLLKWSAWQNAVQGTAPSQRQVWEHRCKLAHGASNAALPL